MTKDATNLFNEPPTFWPAWLEAADAVRLPIGRTCTLGRSENNQVTVPSKTVSRRHAMIQMQGEREYWIIDFGSRNGTYLNGQRLSRPTRLKDSDLIQIGGVQYVFCQETSGTTQLTNSGISDRTVMDVKSATCWLLVADIIDSTKLVSDLPREELPLVVGNWLGECKDLIERHDGRINQFLGDGFFAYWLDRKETLEHIQDAITMLQRLQERAMPRFRFVLHVGTVMVGGLAVGEEENLSGPDVHLTFRLEKLCGSLGETRMVSESVQRRLAQVMPFRSVGSHALSGFDGKFPVYVT